MFAAIASFVFVTIAAGYQQHRLQQAEDAIMHMEQLATHRAQSGQGAFGLIGWLIIAAFCTYVIKSMHEGIKEKGDKEPKLGPKSIACCLLSCCGCCTIASLIWPIDEQDKVGEPVAEKSDA